MVLQLSQASWCWLFSGLLLLKIPLAWGTQSRLPDLGSSTEIALSVEHERLLGNTSQRYLHGSQLLVTDPLLNHYLTELGQRLVVHAYPMRIPLHFYWLNSRTLNAFALIGGHVVLHTALLQSTESESELASVMAHEISHVTQRHLARALEDQQRHGPIALTSAVVSAVLVLANPTAGMAALMGTVGGAQQRAISFTQDNEREADRIGIELLTRAGFDPRAAVTFLDKLAKNAYGVSNPPEILVTHPLPQRRLAETRDRVQQLPSQSVKCSLDYHLAKIRWQLLGTTKTSQYSNPLHSPAPKTALSELQLITVGYQQALLKYRNQHFSQAHTLIQPLLARYPDNLWLIDLMTDIDVALRHYLVAIQRLQQAMNNRPDHPILLLNLANVYLKQGAAHQAIDLLRRYCQRHPQDDNGWQLLVNAYAARAMIAEEKATLAELLALQGHFQSAIQALQHAIRLQKAQPHAVARHQARLAQLQQLKRNS